MATSGGGGDDDLTNILNRQLEMTKMISKISDLDFFSLFKKIKDH